MDEGAGLKFSGSIPEVERLNSIQHSSTQRSTPSSKTQRFLPDIVRQKLWVFNSNQKPP